MGSGFEHTRTQSVFRKEGSTYCASQQNYSDAFILNFMQTVESKRYRKTM